MANRLHPSATSLTSTVDSLSQNQNPPKAGKQMLADTGVEAGGRTRNALGEIGNRLTHKVTSGKEKGTAVQSGVQPGNGPFVVPSGPAPVARGNKLLARANSVVVGSSNLGIGQRIANRTKPVANLLRSQSVLGRTKKNDSKSVPALVRVEERFIGGLKKVVLPVPRKVVASGISASSRSGTSSGFGVSSTVNVNVSSETTKSTNLEPSSTTNDFEGEVDSLSNAFSLQRFDICDIDANDDGPFMVADYIKDISDYLFNLEKRYTIRENFLKERSVNARMRAVLMDWLIEVHNQFGFSAETLFMAGKNLDRYLQVNLKVTRTQLQLVGVTALYLAAKYEEVCTPTMQDFSAVSDNAFSTTDVGAMEGQMLKALGYDLAAPQPVFFLRRFSKAARAEVNLHHLAKYIMELSLVDYTVCHFYPSQIAAGSLALAMMVVHNLPLTVLWNSILEHYTRYSVKDLKPILLLLVGVLARVTSDSETDQESSNKLNAVPNKYARSRLFRTSKQPGIRISVWKARVVADLNTL